MRRTLALPLAKLLQFQLWRPTLNVHIYPVIAITAFLAFKPHVFPLLRLGHDQLSQNPKCTSTALKGPQKGYKKMPQIPPKRLSETIDFIQ